MNLPRLRKSSFLFIAVCLFSCARPATCFAQVTSTTVALSGQPAPGTVAGTTFSGFIWPLVNNSGAVAFSASLTGNSVDFTDDTGIWCNATGSLALVARAGMTAPGSSRAYSNLFGIGPDLDSVGKVTFTNSLGAGVSGVWSGATNALFVVALTGMHAPGTSGTANFSAFDSLFDSAGDIAFAADLTGADTTGSTHGIWTGTVNSLQLAARSGFQAPGTAAGTTFSDFVNEVVNPAGQLAFVADLTIASPAGTDRGIWQGAPSSLNLVARRNSAAPGINGGVFTDFGPVSMNGAGHVLFHAPFAAGNVSSVGMWVGSPGALNLVTKLGAQAPGMPHGTTFTTFYYEFLNASDRIVFYAYDSTGKGGLWAGAAGALSLVAHEGSLAPGAGGANFTTLSSPEINGSGQIAFLGNLDSGAQGVWATDASGAIRLVALPGNTIPVGVGDVRTISYLTFQAGGGNQDGLPSSMNDSGVIAFHAVFTDNSSGVFTATLPSLVRVSSVQKTGGTVQIKFFSNASASYLLQYKNALTDMMWQTLGLPIPGNGGIATATDTTAGGQTRRFYRVAQQ